MTSPLRIAACRLRMHLCTIPILGGLTFTSSLPAAIIAASDFGPAGNAVPAVTWAPLPIEVSSSVPSSTQHQAYLTANGGTIDTPTHLAFLGSYVDQIQADSTSVSSYKWQYLKGALAPTGDTGTPLNPTGGAPYFHVAYATSADGTSGFTQTPSAATTYVGSYVDNSAVDSSVPSAYTWRLLSSVTAGNGLPGVSTVNGQTYYLHLKYSQTGGTSFTSNSGETAYVYPAAPGTGSAAMTMNVDFSGVNTSATSWSGTLKTPILSVSNLETTLSKLNVSFDLKTNRLCPVLVRITSLDANNNPTGYREGLVRPVVVNTFYRYSLDLHKLAAGTTDFQPTAPKVQFSFTLRGTSTDSFSWPRGTGNQWNIVTVDNLSYTRPRWYVAPNGLDTNTGLTESSPKRLSEVIKIAQPGDVICLNGGTYESNWAVLTVSIVSGTPSRWITIRPTSYSSPVVLRSTYWSAVEVFANCNYIDIHGLTIKGWYDGEGGADATAKGLTRADAIADGAKLNTYPGQETNPAYTVFSDHQPYTPAVRDAYGNLVSAAVSSGVPVNTWPATAKYNTNGLTLSGRKKSAGGSDPAVSTSAAPYERIHHIRVADMIVYNNTAAGIATNGFCDYLYFENNHVYNNNKLSRYGGSGISTLENADIDGSTQHKIFILGNVSSNNGLDVRWGPRISTDTQGRKTLTLNYSDGNGIIIDLANNNSYQGRTLVMNNVVFDNGGSGIHCIKSDNVDMINNTAFRNGKPNAAPASFVDIQVRSTTAHSGTTAPYAVYESIKPAWMNKTGGASINYGEIFAQQSSNCTIRNNILWARTGNNINMESAANSNVSYDYNLFGRDGGTTNNAGINLVNAVGLVGNKVQGSSTAADIFANVTDSSLANFLHLRTASPISPAANAAYAYYNLSPREDRVGAARPQGGNSDMGAYEDL